MITTTADGVQALEARHVLQTYRRVPVTFVRGKGVRLYDADGREYFDLLSGIGVASLGHAHPGLARAIAEQAQTLLHTSNLFYHPLQGQLAERLANLSGLPRAFFCNSGTEAVEACLKFAAALLVYAGRAAGRNHRARRSFHGRTMGALSVTSDEHYRAPFAPLLPACASCRPTIRRRSRRPSRGPRPPSSPSRFRAKAASGRSRRHLQGRSPKRARRRGRC